MPGQTMRGTRGLVGELHAMMLDVVQLPPANQLGLIMPDYSLQVFGFRGSAEEPITIPPEQYILDKRLCMPWDFFTQTPDGAASYVTPANPLAAATAPAMEGNHLHNADGDHGAYGGSHTHAPNSGAHAHRVLTPPWLRPLMPGDKVKVSWIDGGDQKSFLACIDAVVVSGLYCRDVLAVGGGGGMIPPPTGSLGGETPAAAPTYEPTPPYGPTPPPPTPATWSPGNAPGVYEPDTGRLIGYRGPNGEIIHY
jgi:hypothetical protein